MSSRYKIAGSVRCHPGAVHPVMPDLIRHLINNERDSGSESGMTVLDSRVTQNDMENKRTTL